MYCQRGKKLSKMKMDKVEKNDKRLMIIHESGRTSSIYFTIKGKNILCFISISSKVDIKIQM